MFWITWKLTQSLSVELFEPGIDLFCATINLDHNREHGDVFYHTSHYYSVISSQLPEKLLEKRWLESGWPRLKWLSQEEGVKIRQTTMTSRHRHRLPWSRKENMNRDWHESRLRQLIHVFRTIETQKQIAACVRSVMMLNAVSSFCDFTASTGAWPKRREITVRPGSGEFDFERSVWFQLHVEHEPIRKRIKRQN